MTGIKFTCVEDTFIFARSQKYGTLLRPTLTTMEHSEKLCQHDFFVCVWYTLVCNLTGGFLMFLLKKGEGNLLFIYDILYIIYHFLYHCTAWLGPSYVDFLSM